MQKQSYPFLGSFVKLKAPHYLEGAVNEANSYHGKALMFFLGSPFIFSPIDKNKLDVQKFYQSLKKNSIALEHVCVHLPYLINLGNCENIFTLEKSLILLKKNLLLGEFLGIKRMVLHPGAALKADKTRSLKQVGKMLSKALKKFPEMEICLETMAGSGSQLGRTFEELQTIIQNCQYSDQINVCFDLCHLYAAGYDIVNDWEGVLKKFDQTVGLHKLKIIHINDSLKPLNSHVDRHANIGHGEIGLPAIQKIVWDARLANTTMILETPYFNNLPLYKKEIALLLKIDEN